MYNISLFAEDEAHEDFLTTLAQRLAETYRVEIAMTTYSVSGGYGRVISELKQYHRDLQSHQEALPHLILVGTDGNCKKPPEREQEIRQAISGFTDFVISAIPEPHIERWLLLDAEVFKTVFGKGCPAPDKKCERDRYKRLLLNAILQAGSEPSLTNFGYVADIVNAMNFQRMARRNDSLGRLLKALQNQFEIWE